jgi:hypothetical protein
MGNKGGKDKSLSDSGKKGKGDKGEKGKTEATQPAKKAEKIDINGKGLEKLSDTYACDYRYFHLLISRHLSTNCSEAWIQVLCCLLPLFVAFSVFRFYCC